MAFKYPAHWQAFVNFTSEYEGRRVQAAYSYEDNRYIMPGELVHIMDEFGYWRLEPPVVFLGRDQYSFLYRDRDGNTKAAAWQVVRGVKAAS